MSGRIDLLLNFRSSLRGLKEAALEVGKLHIGLSKIARAGIGIAAVLGVGAAVGGIADTINTVRQYEDALAGVKAVTNATSSEMGRMSGVARELGKTTKFSAAEAAAGMEFLGMAGFNSGQIIEAIPATLNLAAAGSLELAEAADIASNVLSGFNLKAEETGRVADVIAQAAASSNTNVQQFGVAMSYVAPVAANLKVSLEETAAAIGVLSNSGIQGEKAGSGLRRVIADLINPTPKAREELERLGISIEDLNPTTNSLAEILGTLRSSALDAQSAARIFGEQGIAPILTLMESKGNGIFEEMSSKMNDAAGAAQRMAETRMDTLSGDIAQLSSAFQELQIALLSPGSGANFALRELLQSLRDVALRVSEAEDFFLYFGIVIHTVSNSIKDLIQIFSSLIEIIAEGISGLSVSIAQGIQTGISAGLEQAEVELENFIRVANEQIGLIKGVANEPPKRPTRPTEINIEGTTQGSVAAATTPPASPQNSGGNLRRNQTSQSDSPALQRQFERGADIRANGFQSGMNGVLGAMVQMYNEIGTIGDQIFRTTLAIADAMRDGIGSSIAGLIRGTMTWGDALRNIGNSIVQGMIDSFARMVADFIMQQVVMRAAMALTTTFGIGLEAQKAAAVNSIAASQTPILATNATLASIGSWGIAVAVGLAAMAGIAGAMGAFKTGGYTGDGDPNAPAGTVHKREYVLTAQDVDRIGLPEIERFRFSGGMQPVNQTVKVSPAASGGAGGPAAANVSNFVYFDRKALMKEFQTRRGDKTILDAMNRQRLNFGV